MQLRRICKNCAYYVSLYVNKENGRKENRDHRSNFYVIEAFLFYVVCIKAPGSDFFYTLSGDACGSFFRGADSFYVIQVFGKPWIG